MLMECKFLVMAPFVLPNILTLVQVGFLLNTARQSKSCPCIFNFYSTCNLLLLQELSSHEFETEVLPHLVPLMKVTDPIQILYIFMNNMQLLMSKTPHEQIQVHGAWQMPSIGTFPDVGDPMLNSHLFSPPSSACAQCCPWFTMPSIPRTTLYSSWLSPCCPTLCAALSTRP